MPSDENSRPFDAEKATQAAAEILRLEGKPIGRLRLLKLLYAADRRNVRVTGFPMLSARAVAMDQGPLHSEIYRAIDRGNSHWSKFFQNDGDRVQLKVDPGTDRLSDSDVDILRLVWEWFLPETDTNIIDLFHDLPEYVANYKPSTSTTIPLESVLDAVNLSGEKAAILDDLLAFHRMQEEMAS